MVAVLTCLGGCGGDSAGDSTGDIAGGTDRDSGSAGTGQPSTAVDSSTAASGSHAPTDGPSTSPAALADQLDSVLSTAGNASVRIQVGTAFTIDGTAAFGARPWSLVGHIDFRTSDADSDYMVRDLQISVTVPPGVEFPDSTTATQVNQWGPALSRIDPGVVVAAMRSYGLDATSLAAGDGVTRYFVHLDGPGALAAFGYDASPQMPDTIKYTLEVDAQGRPLTIAASFGDYGRDIVDFEDWT
jgi:hypothetical protein